ncbi:12015_t:CDS:2 [Diversispora eburnea]|uniref:12015_t:CDS:1 n=1 Tax=Diversispora eburnea TaxID=1213867 RepID=A0A9N9FJP3_9GLOM|nr:12015_t:CDS:2 [Diversispora eburnea]
MALKSDLSAGYYYVCTALIVLLVGSIIYLIHQITTYINRTKKKDVPILHSNENNFTSPRRSIHLSPTVWFYKCWNQVIHILGVGEMSIGAIVILLIYLTVNIIFLALPFKTDEGISHQTSIRFAYLGIANAAFIFPLATRNSIFTKLIGIPFERMITYHRWVGRTIFWLLTFHASTQIQSNYNSSKSISHSLWGTDIYKWGFLAYIFLSITVTMANSAISSGVTRIIFKFPTYYEAGQYIFVNFPFLKIPTSLIDWHPFSLSSPPLSSFGSIANSGEVNSPTVDDTGDEGYASIHVKMQGGYTNTLYAKSQQGSQLTETPLKMRIEGPYGKKSVDFSSYKTVLLISGGIGITPIICILGDLIDSQIKNNYIVTQAIHFVWVIPNIELEKIRKSALTLLPPEKYLLEIQVYLTRSTTTPSSTFFQGRPDIKKIMKALKQKHGSGDIAVGVCGPAPLIKEARNAAGSESDVTCLFKTHTETFEL